MIFVHSDIPMYLVGAPHPNKTRAQHLLQKLVVERQRLVTDAEVLQEILHRYAINRRDAIQAAMDALLPLADEVIPIDREAVQRAKEIVLAYARLSARDAVHIAIMERNEIEKILTFDAGFDGFPHAKRLS